jgi:hypothetical protein
MSEVKTAARDTAAEAKRAPVTKLETVAGSGRSEVTDGALHVCDFYGPRRMCRYGDSLIVCDLATIRAVDGVLGVANPMAESKTAGAEYEARAVPQITTAIPVLPKELARLMAQYARPFSGTRTIAGVPEKQGHRDGPALGGALLYGPRCVVLDTSDPVAGPQLMIGRKRTVSLR